MTLAPTVTHDALSRTHVYVDRPVTGGRAVVSMGTDGPADRPVVRPMLVHSDDGGAIVSLVPDGALLLAGDAIRIDVQVGPGARLELIEPAGTVAYAMDGGRATWEVSIDLAPAATLVWAGEPFVVAEGADVDRSTTIRLATGAAMAWRETLVLGRHGERPGTLRQGVDVVGHRDVPLLREVLEVGPASSHLLLGGARAIGSVLVLGRRLPPGFPASGTRLDLQADGTLVRGLALEAHRAVPGSTWAEARRVVR